MQKQQAIHTNKGESSKCSKCDDAARFYLIRKCLGRLHWAISYILLYNFSLCYLSQFPPNHCNFGNFSTNFRSRWQLIPQASWLPSWGQVRTPTKGNHPNYVGFIWNRTLLHGQIDFPSTQLSHHSLHFIIQFNIKLGKQFNTRPLIWREYFCLGCAKIMAVKCGHLLMTKLQWYFCLINLPVCVKLTLLLNNA